MKRVINTVRSPKTQELIAFLRANFCDIPKEFVQLDIRIAIDDVLMFTIKMPAYSEE